MSGNKKEYAIWVNGHKIPVSRAVYQDYKKSVRKERYFMEDLKQERYKVNQETQTVTMIPRREDSLDRLWELGREFAAEDESPEDAAIKADLLKKLEQALHTLSDHELRLVQELFYLERTERDIAEVQNVTRAAINKRKQKVLKKLKKFFS